MGQVSAVLRRMTNGYTHWCPGCGEPHAIYTASPNAYGGLVWSFNGDVDRPVFNPSVKITGKQTVKDAQGNWTGEWVRDANGKPIDSCCHYFIAIDSDQNSPTFGQNVIDYCGDSTHALAGKKIPMPPLPDWLRDPEATSCGP